MKIAVNQVYSSVACNRSPEIIDWNSDGLICFGAKNAIAIYNTKIKGTDPLTVLSHHRSVINSVKWLLNPNGTTELLSCSADKTAAIWSLVGGVWKVTSTLTGHTDGVTCIHGLYHLDSLIVYTGSVDSTVRVWERSNGTTEHKHTISLSQGLCLTLHSYSMPLVNKPLLFCALDDHKIHIFAGPEYHRVHTMVGHEDWVRGLDVLEVDNSLIIASASQDTYIRLWRIQQQTGREDNDNINMEQKVFDCGGLPWAVTLDAVLSGHEGWVYGVQFYPIQEGDTSQPVYRLLSSSLDKTLIIWEPESEGGVWTERVRLGEVGGNGLGFYGSRFGPRGEVLGHGYNGSLHIWNFCKETSQWQPAVVCGGHFSAVEDVRWEPHKGRYIMSVSADQTTRVHAPWLTPDGLTQWHELARPQVHGYDMASLALVSSDTFASAAEEKVIRVFTAPTNFHHNFKNITGQVLVDELSQGPEGASVPSLGLSNKAVFSEEDKQDNEDDNDGYFVPIDMKQPPTEETLMQNTLWPEQQKLYGHGYEAYSLAAAPDALLLASACKATTAEHAAVIIWETKTWQQIQKLVSHQLTVTQMEFSPDSQRLLSVSRDRRWTLFQRRQGSNLFDIASSTDKTNGVHTRIIWSCAWAHNTDMFGTGSRDGKVCVWSKTETPTKSSLGQYALNGKALEQTAAVTALAFAPMLLEGSRIIAIGLETGVIKIYEFDDLWTLLHELDNSAAHHLTVKRLTFKPSAEDRSKQALLASCGSDNLVRIHSITLI